MAQVTTITAGQLGTYHHSAKRTHNSKSNNRIVDISVKRGREINKTGNFLTNHYNLGPKNNRRFLNDSNNLRMKAKAVPSNYILNPGSISIGNDGIRDYNNNGNNYRKGKYLMKEAQNHYRQGGRRNQYLYWGSDLRVQTTEDTSLHSFKDRRQIRYEACL